MTAAIEVRDIVKSFKAKRAVDDISFDVARGEVFGFLGPNGAGKTTTMRVLLGLLRQDAGQARVLGLDTQRERDAVHARVGYLPGDLGLDDRLTARERLRHFARLRGGRGLDRIEPLAARLRLDLDKPTRALSRGNKQKLGLVQAFMHEPELLVLDEPTAGLDPLMQAEFEALVREATARGATVFLSSHILPEVEALCDRVAIIREGRLAAVATMRQLRERAVRRVRARFAKPPGPRDVAGLPGLADASLVDGELRGILRGPPAPLLRALAALDVVELAMPDPTLDDVFHGYYEEARA